jgi:Ca2+-transporting ATPase
MLGNIFITATFFVVVMMALLLGMKYGGWFGGTTVAPEFAPLTFRQVSIFFTVYVIFQVWNQINCRSLSPDVSGLQRLHRNPTFLGIALTIVVVQLLITSLPFLADIFRVEPLGVFDWLVIVAATASVLVFAEVARQFRSGRGAREPVEAAAGA